MDAVRVRGVAVSVGMGVRVRVGMRVQVGVGAGESRRGVGEEVWAVGGDRGRDGACDARFELGEVVVEEVLEEVRCRFLDLVIDGYGDGCGGGGGGGEGGGCGYGDGEGRDWKGSGPRWRLARVPEALGWVDGRRTVHRQRRSDGEGEVVAVDVDGESVLGREKEVAVGPLARERYRGRKEGRVEEVRRRDGEDGRGVRFEVVLVSVGVVRRIKSVGLRDVGTAAAAVELVAGSAQALKRNGRERTMSWRAFSSMF